jgi:glycosyltransferase involved in cell wall biosynthesis
MFHFVSDIFVLPSEYDPSPKVLNEALNFGHPIITTDRVGTAPELIQEGRNGFIFKVGDVEGLADYLEQLIDDIDLRKKFGIESLKIVNNWSIERDVQGWLEALKYVCKK